MKNVVALLTLVLTSNILLAAPLSSTVIFPVNHSEVSPYPGKLSIVLNDVKKGMHNDVNYTLTCHLTNPTKEVLMTQMDIDPYAVCGNLGGCGSISLNGNGTSKMLHLTPGQNTFVYTGLMTASYNPNTKLVFTNYDNNSSVFVDDCKAELE